MVNKNEFSLTYQSRDSRPKTIDSIVEPELITQASVSHFTLKKTA